MANEYCTVSENENGSIFVEVEGVFNRETYPNPNLSVSVSDEDFALIGELINRYQVGPVVEAVAGNVFLKLGKVKAALNQFLALGVDPRSEGSEAAVTGMENVAFLTYQTAQAVGQITEEVVTAIGGQEAVNEAIEEYETSGPTVEEILEALKRSSAKR